MMILVIGTPERCGHSAGAPAHWIGARGCVVCTTRYIVALRPVVGVPARWSVGAPEVIVNLESTKRFVPSTHHPREALTVGAAAPRAVASSPAYN